MGKQKGRDKSQEERWSENRKEVIYALMETFPLPLRISDLQRETGIRKRERLQVHLRELQSGMFVEKVHRGAWRIHPSTFYRLSWQEAHESGLLTPKRIIADEMIEWIKNHDVEELKRFLSWLERAEEK